jgi:siroheme synthase-like protein
MKLVNVADNDQAAETQGNELFPVFLKLNQLQVLLVGAGPVGLEKLTALLSNSPQVRVTIVAKSIDQEVRDLADQYSNIQINQKAFDPADLDDAELVMVASNNPDLNEQIIKEAHSRKLLVNVADKPSLCDFYLGSIVKKGDLKLAISTNGKSPTVAKRLKEVLDQNIPDELNETLQKMTLLRTTLVGDFAYKVKKLNEITEVLVSPQADRSFNFKLKWLIWGAFTALGIALFSYFYNLNPDFKNLIQNADPILYYFLAAGFVFALVDGAIGMSYGVTSTSFSLAMGIPPASASAAVHLSEILSNGIAGWMHFKMGNVNKQLFKLLWLPGILGAVIGAYLLSSLEHYSNYTKVLISCYTLILGIVILKKALALTRQQDKQRNKSSKKIKNIKALGFGGGFVDAIGGGGWGSIVLSSLIAGGRNPRTSLGTVKITRFFIAIMSSLTFITMLAGIHWPAIIGLVIGSAIAAPIAAKASNKISVKYIMLAVALIVIIVSVSSISKFILKVL